MSGAARPATPEDVDRLVVLMAEFYAESGYTLLASPARKAFERVLEDPRLGVVWVMEHGSAVVGYVVLTLSFSMEYGALRGFVDDLFVQPLHRRRGLASAALRAIRDACPEQDIRALHVETGPGDSRALSLYERAGFRDSGHLLLTLTLDEPVHAT